MGHDGSGNAWTIADPKDSEVLSDGAQEIRDLRTGVGIRVDKEHVALAAGEVGGEHKEGSAVGYVQEAAPVKRPDGSTDFTTADDGRIWFDSDSLLKYRSGNDWVPVVASSIVDNSITATKIPDGSILPVKLAAANLGKGIEIADEKLQVEIVEAVFAFDSEKLDIKDGGVTAAHLAIDVAPRPYVVITHEVAAIAYTTTTGAGAYTPSNIWVQRVLNVEKVDTNNLVTLDSNNITFTGDPSATGGKWIIRARVPGYSIGSHIARVVNTTGPEVLLEGSSAANGNAELTQTDSHIIGELDFSSTALPITIRIEHKGTGVNASSGLGKAVGHIAETAPLSMETYTVVELWRIAE